MVSSFAKEIKQSRIIKALPSETIVKRDYWDSYYNHFTLRVKTLAEYIDVISRLSRIAHNSDFNQLVFRGHSDASSNYKLIPAIARKDYGVEFCEESLIKEMLTLRPEEFVNISTDFDLLSKLQHFGLPTRLLDFTYNPLIALFFACCSDKKTDSRVICTYDTSSSFTADIVEKICGLYKYLDPTDISLDGVLGGVSRLNHYANSTFEHLMAKPKYTNDRIKHQSAVFMIFPNAFYDFRSRMVVLGRKHGNEEEYRLRFSLNEEENRRLEYIRKEPQIYDGSFNVNSQTLKKLLSYYSNQFDDFYSTSTSGINEKYHFIFKNRFTFFGSVQELSKEMISQCFISILIENKYRKRMLQELEMVGIDKAFVFPELEYTAEMVKNRIF